MKETAKKAVPQTVAELEQRLAADAIEFILAQFVNIHGAAKVKMVPARCVTDIVNGVLNGLFAVFEPDSTG